MSTDKKEYGISVIIPCYNVGQYVEETLKSVLNQSFKNYEIICLNDGSTDGTEEVCQIYAKKYPEKITYIFQENKGLREKTTELRTREIRVFSVLGASISTIWMVMI